jgi:hypothetical protein
MAARLRCIGIESVHSGEARITSGDTLWISDAGSDTLRRFLGPELLFLALDHPVEKRAGEGENPRSISLPNVPNSQPQAKLEVVFIAAMILGPQG